MVPSFSVAADALRFSVLAHCAVLFIGEAIVLCPAFNAGKM
jgi:hypothetical protein